MDDITKRPIGMNLIMTQKLEMQLRQKTTCQTKLKGINPSKPHTETKTASIHHILPREAEVKGDSSRTEVQ